VVEMAEVEGVIAAGADGVAGRERVFLVAEDGRGGICVCVCVCFETGFIDQMVYIFV